MCLAKIGPNAGPGFQRGVALRATVDEQVAWVRCSTSPGRGGAVGAGEELKQVELFDAVTSLLLLLRLLCCSYNLHATDRPLLPCCNLP